METGLNASKRLRKEVSDKQHQAVETKLQFQELLALANPAAETVDSDRLAALWKRSQSAMEE